MKHMCIHIYIYIYIYVHTHTYITLYIIAGDHVVRGRRRRRGRGRRCARPGRRAQGVVVLEQKGVSLGGTRRAELGGGWST